MRFGLRAHDFGQGDPGEVAVRLELPGRSRAVPVQGAWLASRRTLSLSKIPVFG